MTFTPRRLLLNLLDVTDGGVLTASQALQAGAVFDISASSVRVTLTRLTKEGLVESAGRGSYRLGAAARGLGEEVSRWREVDRLLSDWSGAWNACFLTGTSSSDRPAARATDRALAIGGLRQLAPSLFVRPDNLRGGARALHERLLRLGLSSEAIVANLDELDAAAMRRVAVLWDGDALSVDYRVTTDHLRSWLNGADALPAEIAARECFLLGDAAIRKILFDPLLPAPLVDARARADMVAITAELVSFGGVLWHDILAMDTG